MPRRDPGGSVEARVFAALREVASSRVALVLATLRVGGEARLCDREVDVLLERLAGAAARALRYWFPGSIFLPLASRPDDYFLAGVAWREYDVALYLEGWSAPCGTPLARLPAPRILAVVSRLGEERVYVEPVGGKDKRDGRPSAR